MTKHPLISVIIPTFNRKELLSQTLASVLGQTYPRLEVLVCDDGSTDGTDDYVHGLDDSRVKYLKLLHSGLPAVARNAGIRTASGEYIAFVDSDDLWLPQKLEAQLEVAQRHPGHGLFCCDTIQFSADAEGLGDFPKPLVKSGHLYTYLLFTNFIKSPTILVPARVFKEVGLFDERPGFRAVEDYELCLRIAARYPILFLPRKLAKYRIHPDGISQNKLAEFDKLDEVYRSVFATVKTPHWIQRKVLAKNELRRFKNVCITGKGPTPPAAYLKSARRHDAFNFTALILSGLVHLFGVGFVRRLF